MCWYPWCPYAPKIVPMELTLRHVRVFHFCPHSFGHAMMEILSPELFTLTWYRNIDGGDTPAETVTIERLTGCKSRR